MTSEYRHTPVLLAECLEYSNLKPQHTFVDATLGGAGHSFEAAKLIGSGGTLIGIDQDEVALAAARRKLGTLPDDVRPRLELVRGNFGNMDEALLSTEVPGVDAVLFDLGVSSVQIDTPSRGFSFKENGPLDMRMDPGKQTLTAAEIINTYTAADLTRIIRTRSGPAVSRTSRCARGRPLPSRRASSWSTSSKPPSPPRPAEQGGIRQSARSKRCASR